MNVLQLLKKDHATVASLFSKFDRSGESSNEQKAELFAEVRREIEVHSKAEEEIFYSALKAVASNAGRNLISEAAKEHKEIDDLLIQLARIGPGGKNFDETMEMLIENVEHHVEEEEGEIFQFAQENCTPQQLDDLGRQIEERKRTLDQQMAA